MRTGILLCCLALLAKLAGAGAQPLPPGPVGIVLKGEVPSSGVVGKEWTGEFTTTVEGGVRDEGVPADQVTWKWLASVIEDDPESEDDDETGVGVKSDAVEASFDPVTGSGSTRLTLRFHKSGTVHVRLVVEFANKAANTVGVCEPRVFKIKIAAP